MQISENIKYVGVTDKITDLFYKAFDMLVP